MVKRIGSRQHKTRQKLKRHYRERGKLSLSQYFQELKVGDIVNLKINSNIQRGQFLPTFHGLTGVVSGKQGRCYEVSFWDRDKEKKVFTHPIHLKKQE